MKTMKLFSLLGLVFCTLLMVSCEKNLEPDTDIIEGKWRNAAVLDNELLLEEYPWKAKDYIEYAPYDSKRANRTVWEYTYSSDEDFVSEKNGTYTIRKDTLFRVDNSGSERFFVIQYVDENTLIYTNTLGETFEYRKYNK